MRSKRIPAVVALLGAIVVITGTRYSVLEGRIRLPGMFVSIPPRIQVFDGAQWAHSGAAG